MPAKKSYTTFKGGMVIDSDPSIKKPDTYDYAENLRFIADSESNTGALYTPESSKLLNVLSADQLNYDERIVGHCVIREYLIIFTRRSVPGDFEDSIIRFTINNDILEDKTVIATDTDWLIASNNKDGYLSTVGRYDSENNIRVYFATEGKPLRSINITEVFTGDITRLDIVPSSSLSSINNIKTVAGNLSAGKVQYGYSLYKINSQETAISSLTPLLPIFTDPVDLGISGDIKGDADTSSNTGKGFSMEVSLDSSDKSYFDYIRLYRVQYSNYLETPFIYAVNDFIISGQDTVVLTDTGVASLGEITLEEFSLLSSFDFNAYTIEEKDNYLFAANLEDNSFNVEYDARAYRFNNSSEAHLFSSYGVYTTPDYIINGTDGSVTDNTGGGVSSWEDIPEQASCINPYNDYTYWEPDSPDDDKRFVYDGTHTLEGGEGPNVSYRFTTYSLYIDDTAYSSTPTKYSAFLDTTGYSDYSNPYICSTRTGYQRNEVYRFGIEFFNSKGQKSPVKWIGDIRMPLYEASDSVLNKITEVTASRVKANVLGVSFSFNNIPSAATSYRIVRAKRTSNDKSIVTAGLASITSSVLSGYTSMSAIPMINPDTTLAGGDPITGLNNINRKIISFIDPESLLFKTSNVKSSYWFENAAVLKSSVAGNSSGDSTIYPYKNKSNFIKYRTIDPIAYDGSEGSHTFKYSIPSTDQFKFFENTSSPGDTYTFTNSGPNGYTHQCLNTLYNVPSGTIDYTLNGLAPSCNIIDLDVDFDTSQYAEASFELPVVNFEVAYMYLINNNTTRYGGFSYTSRNNTEYIPCSNNIDSGTTTSDVYGGDTYINYFNYVNCLYSDIVDGGAIATDNRTAVNVTFPVESQYNLSLRHDTHFTKVSNNENAFLIGERGSLTQKASVYGGVTYTYLQEDDLYLYNTVYSQEQSVNYNYSIDPSLFTYIYDTRVVYSDKKLSNELIDSWSKFRPNNFLETSSQYGPIYSLKKYNNEVYFHQDNAFGQLFINQRSLVNDDNLGALSLGTGGVLETFKYITTKYGADRKSLVTNSNDGVYFYDIGRQAILKYSEQGFKNLSDVEGLRSYVRNLTLNTLPMIVSNAGNNEVYFGLEDGKVLVYNNFIEKFIGVYDIPYRYILDLDAYIVYQTGSERFLYGLYLDDTVFGSFGDNVYTNSTLTVTNSADFTYVKVFDNLFWYSTCKQNSEYQNSNTFDTVECWNDYQYTGSINLSNSNLRRSERKFFHPISRNIVNDNGTGDLNIFDSSNHSPSALYRDRMRGEYITTKFTYNNAALKGMLSVPYIGFTYRQSIR